METFADVLHSLVDHVLTGDLADKAHAILDKASGVRTQEEPPPADPEPPAPDQADATVPGATEDATPTA